MIKTKKQSMIVIGAFILTLLLGTTTYAFFNYTRTGSSNNIRVGRISFISKNEETISLTNLFPIDPSNTSDMNDSTKVGTYSIDITGDTDYVDGIEYLVSAVDANIYTNQGQIVPITLDFTVTDLGDPSTNYFTARESKNANIYKKLVGDTLVGDQMLLVGFIKKNTTSGTAEGVDGNITIKAYLDKNKILISDTYDGTESDNMGTPNSMAQGKTVFTTSEWNSLSTNGVSFKIKVEANEGVWVEEPLTSYTQITRNVITPSNPINFAYISSSSNGEGLYILPGTENDPYPIYYYRGAVDDNNVVFAGYCWQMVRTTDTGGIKMIYNGEPVVTGSGANITYDCGGTRPVGHIGGIKTTTSISSSTGYYYADDYEIVSGSGYSITYRLKQGTNPITQVAVTSANASTVIPDIATNYPYTCKQTTADATCTTLYKIDSQSSVTTANVYTSTSRSSIGNSAFNTNYESTSDVGYMSNTRYPYSSSSWTTNALFASAATWVTDHYELTDASVTTPDTTHHYSCNATTANATCTSLRYVYYVSGTKKYYIALTGGETLEDALYKMTGNGDATVVARNSSYNLNVNNSTAKTAIDNWFRTNLTSEVDANNLDYSVYLEDTVYCNDRSYKTVVGNTSYPTFEQSGWNKNGGDLTKYLSFGSVNRARNNWYSTTNVPSVVCPNETDRFTVSNTNGNGALTYPVGLLTADEIVMAGAGGNGSSNSSYYLYTGDYYWSLAPGDFGSNSNVAHEFYVRNNGSLNVSNVFDTSGLRPVVSLKPGTEFKSDGDGTGTNPYVIG